MDHLALQRDDAAAPPADSSGTNFQYAGFWRRVAATCIDWAIEWVASYVVGFVVSFLFFLIISPEAIQDPAVAEALAGLIGWVVAVLVGWLYYAIFESSPKQATPGKMALGLVVTDIHGCRLSFGRATGRYFAKIISVLTLGIGFIMAGFTPRKQGLHDFIASTVVLTRR